MINTKRVYIIRSLKTVCYSEIVIMINYNQGIVSKSKTMVKYLILELEWIMKVILEV